jgi:type III restriction enzyme
LVSQCKPLAEASGNLFANKNMPQIFNIQELVLQVSPSFEPTKLRLNDWQAFLNVLCGNRRYQREAIETALIYLFGGRYRNIEDLVKENVNKNVELARRYNNSFTEYERKLQLPKRLSATIDLATGTGKSFVMYGIAQIALALGVVDKVLVLCPSLTIKNGLTDKFEKLASDSRLLNALPETAHIRNPRIINADQTIKHGDICVTNIHAVYSNNSSSILDSLGFGKGSRCLVLNDEVHHAYNRADGNSAESKSLKEWSKFLLDNGFDFRFMLGFTGTAYIENEYFNDVIYRYSLRQAIENNFVKKVFYVDKDDGGSEDTKFQKIYQNHQKYKLDYPELKPLTILITKDIKEAKRLHTRLSEFLAKQTGEGSLEEIGKKKVLLVTSDKDHKANVLRLPHVDEKEEKAEWIISVAMLTEGWDVKNVFQIVPMEEKAFNSKLLIAQVLGRGLRLPEKYPNSLLTVFNHHKFSDSISELVREILEIEQRLTNSPLVDGERAKFHFTLWNFDYSREPRIIPAKDTGAAVLDLNGTIDLTSETFEHDTETTFVDIDGEQMPVTFKIEKPKTTVAEIVGKIIKDFEIRDWEGKTLKLAENQYTQNNLPPRQELEALIYRSMESRGIQGDALGNQNRNKVYMAFGTLFPKADKTVNYQKKANPLFEVSTEKREHDSVSFSSLRQNATVFFTSDYDSEIVIEDAKVNFQIAKADRQLRGAFDEIRNSFLFKTPLDLVFTSHEPERKFVELLCEQQNAGKITAWIKSANKGFYSIPYSIDTGDGRFTTQHSFNPDFFLKVENRGTDYIIAVETKSNGDDSTENKAKYKDAKKHFQDLNNQLKEKGVNQTYIFHFVCPDDFPTFFDYLRSGSLIENKFKGQLEELLEKE